MSAEKTIFISYRRQPAAFIARAIYQHLRQHDYDVFMDIESIDSGTFDTIILNQIAARQHFILILTPGTLERCDEPGDWLRREIEYAMEKQRNIVPLLVNEFKFGNYSQYLTGKLAELSRFNAVNVPHDYFDAAMDKLRTRFLVLPMQGRIETPPPQEQKIIQEKQKQADVQPAPTEKQLTAEQYFNQAFDHKENGRLAEAIRDYTEAIRLNPQYAVAHNNRGNARNAQGDLAGAIADYNEAIRLNPQDADAYYNRGNARNTQGDLAEAIADYNEALRLNPQDADAYYNRGVARKAQGDYSGAIADYNKALRLNPQYVDAYYNRGNTRKAQGDLAGAIADYNEALRLNPQYVDAYNNRGNTRKAQGDLAGAIADYTEALRLNPQNAIAYYNRGIVYENQQNIRAAIADFEQYLALGGGRQYSNQKAVEEFIQRLKKQL